MPTPTPRITVVIPTRDRPDRLAAALASLRAQTIDADAFEVIVVDDPASPPSVAEVLSAACEDGLPQLSVVTRTEGSAAAARNDGWRAAAGELVAFTDDDCELSPGWLAAGLDAWDGSPQTFVQGRTAPLPAERDRLDVFAYTIDIPEMSAEFETCNIFYPRHLLDQLGGFDPDTHVTSGEDTDLAWRAIRAGARPRFAPEALAYHAVIPMTPRSLIRRAWNFSDAIIPFGAFPELRERRLIKGMFWNWSHYLLVRALVALVLPRRAWPLSVWLALPLIRFQLQRARSRGGGPQHVPWLVLYDSVELAAVLRGAARARTVVI